MCHSVPVFSTCPFQSTTVFQCVTGTQPHDEPARRYHGYCAQVTRQARTNAIHHTSNANLLQASVKPCCDLPKQNTFSLLLLCLLYSNSNPNYDIFLTHSILLYLLQFVTTTDYYQNRKETPWKLNKTIDCDVLRQPAQLCGTLLVVISRTMQHDIGKVATHHTIITPHLLLLCVKALKIYNFKTITKQVHTFIRQQTILYSYFLRHIAAQTNV